MTKAAPIVPTLKEIRAAAVLLAPYIIGTPLLRLNSAEGESEIYLKLENLQPIGAYKVRSMGHVMLSAKPGALMNGAYTASSGNAGLGLAWMARQLGVAARVYVPRSSPAGKLAAIEKFGARIHMLEDDAWWRIIENGGHPKDPGLYVDAVRSPDALAGNGTIGLEINAQLPGVDTVIIPFGGGGVACGVAAAFRALKPETRIVIAESDAATPASAAMSAGGPVEVPMKPSFISGAGAPCVLEEMWPLVHELIDDSVVTPVGEVAAAIRLLYTQNRIVVEGAGAIPVAAALAGKAAAGKTVCVVTGGNIDPEIMARILQRQL